MPRASLVLLLIWIVSPLSASAAGPASMSNPEFGARLDAVRDALKRSPERPPRFQLASMQEREMLLLLLRDPDASVRKASLRSLRAYVNQTVDSRQAVLNVYLNGNEDPAVRYQAAKTLSYVAHYHEIADRLAAVALHGDDSALRAISYKALYVQAVSSNIQDRLIAAALREPDKAVRLGAIWGLFTASANSRPRDALLAIASRDPDIDVRVAALKSLAGAMGASDLRDRVLYTARDSSAEKALRYPCILLLSRVIDSRTRDTLIELARFERDPELREAAILALNPSDERITRYFHLIRRDHNGVFIDPLDEE